MPRKGELKPMDAHEQKIRDNAVAYTVIGFQPGTAARTYATFDSVPHCIAYGKQLLKDVPRIRSVMIYALDEGEHHALVGTIKRDMKYNEVIPATY